MRTMKSPAFQFYPSDWLSSRAVRLMDAEQRGWYIQLLAESWQSRPQASLPNDPLLLQRLADADDSSPNFDTRWQFVISQFKVKGQLLINDRLAHEKQKQNDYHQQRKEAGAKGAAKRWRETPETKPDTEKVSHRLAIAEPSLSHVSANGKTIASDSFSSSSSTSSSIATSKEKKEMAHAEEPRSPRNVKLCDEEYLDKLQDMEAYALLDVRSVHSKMVAWCENKGKQATRGRLLNWLNREDLPMSNVKRFDPARHENGHEAPRPPREMPIVTAEELELLGIKL